MTAEQRSFILQPRETFYCAVGGYNGAGRISDTNGAGLHKRALDAFSVIHTRKRTKFSGRGFALILIQVNCC